MTTMIRYSRMRFTSCKLVCTIINLCVIYDSSFGKIPLHIRSLISYDSYDTSVKFAAIQQNATDHVNMMEGLLDHYELCYGWEWTLDSTDVLSVLYDYVHNKPKVLMLFGPPFSGISALVNPVAARYHLIQVTTSNSPAIGDLTRYPYTVQIFPDENELNYGRIGFINLMKWKRVAIIFEDVEYFRVNMEHLARHLDILDIEILSLEAVNDVHNQDLHVKNILRQDARILIIAAYRWTVVNFACTAYAHGLYGPKYVLILQGWLMEGKKPWQEAEDLPCDGQQVAEVMEGSVYIHTIRMVADVEHINYNGQKPGSAQRKFASTILKQGPVIPNVLRHFYDGVFNMAIALNSSIEPLSRLYPPRTLDDFDYMDDEMGDILRKNARNMDFTGLTGQMLINNTRDSGGMLLYISQFIGFKLKLICYFDYTGKHVTWFNNGNFSWKGNIIPVDGKFYQRRLKDISISLRVVVFIFTSLGICLAFVFLAINVKYRNHRAMKISSPNLNNFIVTGCVLLYSSVFLPAINASHSNMIYLCYAQLSLLTVGMSLSLGALFMKSYRIRAIFQGITTMKKVNLTDVNLIPPIVALVALDIFVICLWAVVDGVYIGSHSFEPQLNKTIPEMEIYTVYEMLYCTSEYQTYFSGCMYIIKTVLLVYGVSLAWQTREVTIRALNDSKFIAMAVYTIAVVSMITVPALHVVSSNVDAKYLINSVAVVITNTAVLSLVFIPKFIIFAQTKGSEFTISSFQPEGSGELQPKIQLKRRLLNLRAELEQKADILMKLQIDLKNEVHGETTNRRPLSK